VGQKKSKVENFAKVLTGEASPQTDEVLTAYIGRSFELQSKNAKCKNQNYFSLHVYESNLLPFFLQFSIFNLHFALGVFKNPGPDLDYGINRLV